MPPRRNAKRDRMRQDRQNARHARKRAETRAESNATTRASGAGPQAPRAPAAPQPAGQAFELEISGMAPGGEALGRHEGLVVFVAGALPGERVRVEVTERRSSWARARLLEVLVSAPARVAPRCRHFGLCGGCDWQMIDYPVQAVYKTGIVREQLARFAHLPDANVRPCLPGPAAYGYRNTARLAVNEAGRAGYHVAGSQKVFGVAECPILEEALMVDLDEVRAMTLHPGDEVTLRVASPLRVGDHTYHVSADSFFQVNSAMAARLVEQVLSALKLQPGDAVLDLYAGVGLFTLPMAHAVGAAGRVLAVEAMPTAVADGRQNTLGIAQTGWLRATVEEAVSGPEVGGVRWSHILLDPPRRGVDGHTLRAIAALGAPTLVYVSCDPATLARDTRLLLDEGYTLRYAQPLDLFPQTAHVETVTLFARAE